MRWQPGLRFRGRSGRRALVALWIASCATLAAPVFGQIAGSIAVQNDYRVRGYAISGGRPAAILSVSYDHASGAYLGASAIGALDRGDDPVLLGVIGNLGYARRIAPRISLDVGYVRTQYAHYVGAAGGDAHYDEVYAGLSAHGLSAHVYVSPDYFRRDVSTLYGELDGVIRVADVWRLSGHVGVLDHLSRARGLSLRDQYDWRFGIARPIRRLDLHVGLTGGGPGRDYYRHRAHGKTAIVGGMSWSF